MEDMMIITELTVTCSGVDRAGAPTHDRTVVADLAIDDHVGIDPEAGRPRPSGELLDCQLCGYSAPIGKRPHKRLRRVMMRCRDAGVSELPLRAMRRALDC